MEAFDYIVIGAGSAGCVVASRLSENPSTRVLLLEAGPAPRSPWIDIPAGVSQLIFPGKYNWGYSTEPEPQLAGRRIYAPRGKTLGGSSAINGMLYLRGHPQDFDGWRQLGNAGWAWDDVLPHYRRMERYHGGESDIHGGSGELDVTESIVKHPSSRDFVRAGASLGLAESEDLNNGKLDSVGFAHFSIRNGRRASSAAAFLAPAMRRDNLRIETEAMVERIVMEGRKAVAVTFRRDGQSVTCRANREIVLSAGTIDSPRLLMMSGIGAPDQLRAHGIDVNVALPGVGENLQDHIYVHTTWSVTPDSSVNRELRGWRKYMHGAGYLLTRRGLLTLASSQACGFVRALPGSDRPDLQVVFRPMSWEFDPLGALVIGKQPAFGLSSCQLRPLSRGRIELRSSRYDDPAKIIANYLDHPVDRMAAVEGVRWMRRFAAADPLRGRIVSESLPGTAAGTDDEILAYARETMQSVHHWAGSCKMGGDPMAVVDERLKVRGVEGLRVIDASIMPTVTSGNTNAPAMMIGAKGAHLILADAA